MDGIRCEGGCDQVNRRATTSQGTAPEERGKTMKSPGRIVAAVVLGLFLVGAASADTLELKDGRILHGRYLGGTQAVLRFEIDGQVQTFYVSETVALTFTGDPNAAGAAAPAPAPAAATPSAPATPPETQEAPASESVPRPVLSQDVPPPAARAAESAPASTAAPAPPPAPAPALRRKIPRRNMVRSRFPRGKPCWSG